MKAETKILETPDSCTKFGREHKIYALEFITDEPSKTVVIPSECTVCGTMFLHSVQLN